ncbi:MAG: pyridoxal-phosphate dependent enzyme [Dissulfurispiraceae bacterium]
MGTPSKESSSQAFSSVLDTIGHTPLVQIAKLARHLDPRVSVFAKMERGNPGGSVKDRAACRMIGEAEAAGLLTPGKIILDSTSGNTGIAYAMIGAVKGYRLQVVIPETASAERKKIMTSFGAHLVVSGPFKGADGDIRRAEQNDGGRNRGHVSGWRGQVSEHGILSHAAHRESRRSHQQTCYCRISGGMLRYRNRNHGRVECPPMQEQAGRTSRKGP